MREYKIYIIREDIAYNYYGVEDKLFQLFEENREAEGSLKDITDRQIKFIIEKIPVLQLKRIIEESLMGKDGYEKQGQNYFLRLSNMKSQAGLYLEESMLTLYAEGTYDAEAHFYEILREFHPFFIALELDEKRFGWLKPLKQTEIV